MILLVLVNTICFATLTTACGPPFIAAPSPPPTYYACSSVSNGPPCIGSTVTTCVCTNGQTGTSCPNDNTFNGGGYTGGTYCCYNNNYNGYISCTCASGTWVPARTYYQVAVSSSGQCSITGGYPYGRKKRSIEMLKEEMAQLETEKNI